MSTRQSGTDWVWVILAAMLSFSAALAVFALIVAVAAIVGMVR